MSCELKLTPFVWDLPAITAGDSYPGILIEGTDEPDGIDLVRVQMQMRNASGAIVLDLDSDDTGITIVDVETWEFRIEAFTAPTVAGVYKYDIQTTDSAGDIATIVRGTLTIEEQQTA